VMTIITVLFQVTDCREGMCAAYSKAMSMNGAALGEGVFRYKCRSWALDFILMHCSCKRRVNERRTTFSSLDNLQASPPEDLEMISTDLSNWGIPHRTRFGGRCHLKASLQDPRRSVSTICEAWESRIQVFQRPPKRLRK
jgi:hypothetical protein